ERALGQEVSEALNPGQQVVKIVQGELEDILGGETRKINLAKNPPTVIMLVGLQGAGKTTLAGKLSKHLKQEGTLHCWWLLTCSDQMPSNSSRSTVSVPAFQSMRHTLASPRSTKIPQATRSRLRLQVWKKPRTANTMLSSSIPRAAWVLTKSSCSKHLTFGLLRILMKSSSSLTR